MNVHFARNGSCFSLQCAYTATAFSPIFAAKRLSLIAWCMRRHGHFTRWSTPTTVFVSSPKIGRPPSLGAQGLGPLPDADAEDAVSGRALILFFPLTSCSMM